VKNKKLHLKNSDAALPDAITKTLMELERAGEDYMPLIRFWRKLSKSPHQNSKDQLYSFIIHNKIQITEHGDVVLEKGVVQKANGMPDEFVDDYTKKIDHSIGSYVSMPREKVVDNKNQTCAAGLHAAPPSYVRDFYKQSVLVEIIVNPADIVSVPIDYNSRKVRCCAYRVAGYSLKTPRNKQIIKLSEFITDINDSSIYNQPVKEQEKSTIKTTKIEEIVNENKSGSIINLGGLSGKAIVAITMQNLNCQSFGGPNPSKSAVLKTAADKFSKAGWTVSMNENCNPIEKETEEKILNNRNFKTFENMTAKEVVAEVMKDLKCDKFGGDVPRKAQVLEKARKLYADNNWKIKN